MDVDLVALARREGACISFGSDAHHPWQLIFLALALAAALRAGVPPGQIINFKSREDLLAWVAEVRAGRPAPKGMESRLQAADRAQARRP